MNYILKQIFTLLTVASIFIAYILMQNYTPNNKQSVGIAIIEKNHKFLLVQDTKEDGCQSKWYFLSGNVADKENLIDCLKRVLKEKLSIAAQIGNYIGTSNYCSNNRQIELHAFMVSEYAGKMHLNQQDTNLAWVTAQEMPKYDILESHVPFVKMLQLKY